MAFSYSPRVFAPEHVQEIFSEVLFGSPAIKKGLVRPIVDIKHSRGITTLTGEIELGARVDHVTDAVWAATGNNLLFADATITPVELMALEKFNMTDLRNSRFGKDMAKGARNVQSNEFETAVLDYTLPRIGLSYERRMFMGITAATKTAIAASSLSTTQKAWAAAQTAGLVDGFTAQMLTLAIAGASLITVVGTTITASNIATEYGKIYAAAPAEIASHPDTVIFAPPSDRALILQFNLAQTNRDTFMVNGLNTENESITYLGVPVEFVQAQGRNAGAATGVPIRTMGRAKVGGDYAFGTDLLSDQNTAQIEKVNAFSTDIGMRMDMTLGTAVLVPQQKVLYL